MSKLERKTIDILKKPWTKEQNDKVWLDLSDQNIAFVIDSELINSMRLQWKCFLFRIIISLSLKYLYTKAVTVRESN